MRGRGQGRRAGLGLSGFTVAGRIPPLPWGGSSAGRARRSQCRGREFDPPPLHHRIERKGPRARALFHCGRGLPTAPEPGNTDTPQNVYAVAAHRGAAVYRLTRDRVAYMLQADLIPSSAQPSACQPTRRDPMTSTRIRSATVALLLGLGGQAQAQQDVLPPILTGDLAVNLFPIATGLAAPDYAISPPGDLTRLFVVEQNGLLRVLQNGSLLPTPALDVQSRVAPPLVPGNANDERGFLGLAFHPGYANPASPGYRTLYTYTSEPIPAGTAPTYPAPNNATQNYQNVVSEWKISATDPNQVDASSRRELMSFGKNAGNHNGGTIAFGRDGYLYLGLGDGGNANDVGPSHIEPGGNAQNLSTPLGKMLRIDPLNPALTGGSPNPVSANGQYRIPTTNPFQGPGQVPETYALGFRNPYRFAFDTLNGQCIIADVGQNTIEEIDRLQIGGNFGWAQKEGDFLFNRVTGPGGNAGTVGARSPGLPMGLIDPIVGTQGTLEYDHGDGISVTGGFVYRGSLLPELFGKYIFGDLALRVLPPRVDGRLFYADLTTGLINEFQLPQFPNGILPNGLTLHGFGEGSDGEIYAMVTNTPSNGTGGI